jgi:hypothetical protein
MMLFPRDSFGHPLVAFREVDFNAGEALAMKVHGACHCGTIAYEAEVDPTRVTVCHCRDCQVLSGAAFRASVPAAIQDFCLLRGAPKRYIKTAESGNRRVQVFCGDCGTPLYAADAEGAKNYNLRVGPFAERGALPPQRQIWCEATLAWTRDLLRLPKIEKQ